MMPVKHELILVDKVIKSNFFKLNLKLFEFS